MMNLLKIIGDFIQSRLSPPSDAVKHFFAALNGNPTRQRGMNCHSTRPPVHPSLTRRVTIRLARIRWQATVITTVFTLLLTAPTVGVENQWDISPYDVRVWIAVDPSPEVGAWRDRLPAQLVEELGLTCGAGWQITATSAPEGIDRLIVDLENVTSASIAEHDAQVWKADKLFLVRLDGTSSQKRLTVCEVDCTTQQVGPPLTGNVMRDERLDEALANTILDAFSPIALIGRAQDKSAVIRMRAGMLDVQRRTPIIPADGTMMQIVLRKSDRHGNLLPNGIEVMPWTVLLVTPPSPDDASQSELAPGVIHCQIVSGLRNPIRSRGSRRVERFALAVRPRHDHSVIELNKRGESSTKLAGYDLYQRLPGEKTTTWVGRSDWRGQLRIERDEHPLKTFYVKNGGRLLARLPIVVGVDAHVTAELTDDNLRLEAEGFLRGLQEEFVDLVARRKVLAMRVQRRIDDGKLDAAEKLIDELRELQTKQDLERRIRERQATFQTRDKTQQERINRLFRDTRNLLSKHLDTREIDDLRAALDTARRDQ